MSDEVSLEVEEIFIYQINQNIYLVFEYSETTVLKLQYSIALV